MASYPDETFPFRLIENVPGVEYDPDNKKRLFAEDIQSLANEIAAIEETLGLNINGDYDTLNERIADLHTGGSTTTTILETVSTIDETNLNFIFDSKPSVIFVNGIGYIENSGWTWSGSTATLNNPVGNGGDIFAFSSDTNSLSAAGLVNDTNLIFGFDTKPKVIYINGIGYRENHGWTWDGTQATLFTPVGTGGQIFAIL